MHAVQCIMLGKRKSKEQRRAELIQIARHRFATTGLAKTTLEMIASDAGLPRPHLYRFFGSKADLVSAVIANEVEVINARRWEQVKRLRSFEWQIVRSLELAVELTEGDAFWSTLITPENVPYTAYAASADSMIRAANAAYWNKILEHAEAKGELRADIDRDMILSWLLGIQFMFMERREIFTSIKDVRRYAELFVIPSLKQA